MNAFLPESLKGAVVLRQLVPEDEERIIGYFESLGEQSRKFFHPHPFDREHARKICCSNAGAYRIVAEYEDRIVGYAWFEASSKSPYPMVGIGISDDFHGRRLGGALMEALGAEARRRGSGGLRLTVYKDNERGVRLYSSLGYRVVGEQGEQHVMEAVFDDRVA